MAVALGVGAVATFATTPRTLAPTTDSTLPPAFVPPKVAARTALVAHVDATRRVDFLMLTATGGDTPAEVLFLPPATVTDVPSLDRQPLAALVRLGGPGLLSMTVTNLTGIRVDRTVLLDDSAFASIIGAVPRFTPVFAVAAVVDGGAIAVPAGAVPITASQGVRLILGREDAGTLAHLATVHAVLDGWCAVLRHDGAARVQAARVDGGTPLVAMCTAAPVLHADTLPVDDVDTGSGERFEVRPAELERLVASEFPSARVADGAPRPRVELLNGVGTVGLATRAAAVLVPAGAHVTLTDNLAQFGQATTEILYYRDSDLAAARRLRTVLGIGVVGRSATPLDVVDITVVLGADFARTHTRSAP